jgi:hypothetical protein
MNKIRYCINCGKKLNHLAYYENTKRCKNCWYKFYSKKSKGKNNPCYIDGRTLKKYYCKCGKEISYKAKRCRKCYAKTMIGKGNPMFNTHFIRVTKNQLVKHHIDLNRKNNREKNVLKLSCSNHSLLHTKAYEFLLKQKLVKKYIKWFKKNYLKKGELNNGK